VQLNQLYFPNAVGLVESTDEEDTVDDKDEDFEEEYQQQDMNLKQALETEMLQHSHGLIDVAINMSDQAEHENLTDEVNGGERETQEEDPSNAWNEAE
jgi:hypothetical protein